MTEAELAERLAPLGFDLSAFVEERGPDKPAVIIASSVRHGQIMARGEGVGVAAEKVLARAADVVARAGALKKEEQ